MALSSGTMVEAQGQLRGDREMREPAFIAAPTFTEGTGDGLGDHIATMPLNMSGFEIINAGDPSSDMSAVNLRTMTTAIAGARDNLGNHIATQALRMSGFEILEAGDPSTQTSVVNLRSMITAIEEGKDNLGNHIATEALQMSGFRIRNVGDPTHDTDVVNLRTMTSAIEAGRDNLGNHIATQNLRMEGFRIVDMADPQDPSDAATMRFVTDQIAAIPDLEAGTGIEVSGGTVSFNVAWGDGRYALRSRSITAGTGLTGGGDLSASRTIGFDTAWGDGRYALRTRTISAGDGLAGGGSLAENRTLAVDHTVVRTSGPQTIGGNKFFTDIVSFNNQRVRHVGDPLAPLDAVNLNTLQSEISDAIAAASLTAGTGITISGNEVSFDTVWGDGRYANHVHDQFGGTTYDAVLGGSTGATTFTHTQGSRPTDAPMDRQFSGIYISNPWGRAQIAMPNEFGVNTMFFRTGNTAEFWEVVSVEGNQTISGNKTFTGTTRFSGQRLIDVGTPTAGTDAANRDFVENAIGSAIAGAALSAGTGITIAGGTVSFDTAWGDNRYALRGRTISAGDGLTGGGSLASDRTLSVDNTVVRTTGSQTISGAKTFTSNLGVVADGVRIGGNTGNYNAMDIIFRNNNDIAQYIDLDQAENGWRLRAHNSGAGFRNLISVNADGQIFAAGQATAQGHAVLGGRVISTGDGLAGGGDLTENLSLSVDGTVMRNDRRQVIEAWSHVSEPILDLVARNNVGAGVTLLAGSVNSNASSRFFMNFEGDGSAWTVSTDGVLRAGTVPWERVSGQVAISAGDGLAGGGALTEGRTLSVDHTVVRTSGNQLIGGNKTFTGIVSFSAQRLRNVGAPVSGTDAANRDFVENAISSAIAGAALSAGTGITIAGGTVSFDTAWGDGRYALRTRTVNAGTGLTGGGSLAADRTINFDTAWGDNRYALRGRTISAGTGLTGGGTLAADRTINFDTSWGDGRYAQHLDVGMSGLSYDDVLGSGPGATTFSHSMGARPTDAPMSTQASGIHVGNQWGRAQIVMPNHGGTVNRMFFRTGQSTDFHEVMSLEENQTVTGDKTFTGNLRVTQDPVHGNDVTRRSWVLAQIGALSGVSYTGVNGVAVDSGSNTISLTGQALAFHSLGSNGLVVRNGAGSAVARSIVGGDGVNVTNGNGVSGNPTLSLDNTVVRTTGNQTIGGNKTFTGLTRVTGRLIVEDPGMAQASPTITIGPGTGLGYHSNENFQLALITNGTRRLMVTEDGDVVLSRQASANDHAVRADRNLIAGVGLTGGGNLTGNRTFALQNIAAGSTDHGAVWYNGTTRSPGRFYGGTQNPVNTETRLNFNGVLYATNFQANAYFHFSDERLKENIADLDRGEVRERLLGLRPVAYEMIETGESAMGLIAQEVREVFPGIVREADDEDGTLSVEYTQLISPMLSVIHDMDGELQAAQAENAELRALLGDMEARLAAIEEMLR